MVLWRATVLGILAAVLLGGVAARSGAADVTPVYLVDGSQYGWRKAITGSAYTQADFSTFTQPCKGSPGPSPVGHFYMKIPQSQTSIGQAWFGTDWYKGTLLSSLTTLKYWTILDYRGIEYAKTLTDELDEYGNRIPMSDIEWTPSTFPTQPIQLYLYVKLSDESTRTLIYRPWSVPGANGFGPDDGSQTRMWQEWDCLNEGYWLLESTSTLSVKMWAEIMSDPDYDGAYLMSPTYSATPVWGENQCPISNGEDPVMGCCLAFEMGARQLSNNLFPPPHNEWWRESYSALGAVDKLTIGVNDGYGWEFSDEYDFQSERFGMRLTDPYFNSVRAINNRAVFDQTPWTPTARSRGPNPPVTWGGYLTQNYAYLMNAVQRAGNYNYSDPVVGRNPDGSPIHGDKYGQLFALYGRVSDTAGDFFKVDDGSGSPIDCYCPNASSKPIVDGQYVRMVGTLYGQSPFEWYFNMFHVVTWNVDPSKYVYSAMFPWRFDTYVWNVDGIAP